MVASRTYAHDDNPCDGKDGATPRRQSTRSASPAATTATLTEALRASRIGVATFRHHGTAVPVLVVVRCEPMGHSDSEPEHFRVYVVNLNAGTISFSSAWDMDAVWLMLAGRGAGAHDFEQGWRAAQRKPVAYLTDGRRSRIW